MGGWKVSEAIWYARPDGGLIAMRQGWIFGIAGEG